VAWPDYQGPLGVSELRSPPRRMRSIVSDEKEGIDLNGMVFMEFNCIPGD